MKRLLAFLIVLAVILGGLYIGWQIKAVQMVTEGIRTACRDLVANPDNLEISVPKPVNITGIGKATVPQIVIKGQHLQLQNGPELANAKLVLNNLAMTGPPFHFTGIDNGYYRLSVTDDAATAYLRKRGVKVIGLQVPLDTLTVTFAGKGKTLLTAEAVIPIINKRFPLTVLGTLLPSSINNEVNYKVTQISVEKTPLIPMKQIEGALSVINPVISFADWPFQSDITGIKVDTGTATVAGRITAVR